MASAATAKVVLTTMTYLFFWGVGEVRVEREAVI